MTQKTLSRLHATAVRNALRHQAAAVILGPRQVGKTTLAQEIAKELNGLYLDLENPQHLAALEDAGGFLQGYADRLVVIDEVQHRPGLFAELRGLIDEGRQDGKGTGRFLLLGSASMDLLRQAEALTGRLSHIALPPLLISETGADSWQKLWLRGGLPPSYLASSNASSMKWRREYIRSYMERELPEFTDRRSRIPTQTLMRLWQNLAHCQGETLNTSRLATNLNLAGATVNRYVSLLHDLMLVRRLPAWHGNIKKRIVKAPRIYLRDSGLVHQALGISTQDQLMGHPCVGKSWEGMVLENLLAVVPADWLEGYLSTHSVSEVYMLLELPGVDGPLAVEIKTGSKPRVSRGFHQIYEDVGCCHAFVTYPGRFRYPLMKGNSSLEAIGLNHLMELLHHLETAGLAGQKALQYLKNPSNTPPT